MLAIATLAALGSAQAVHVNEQPARATVNFDFGWRFSRGFEPRSGQCMYEQNTNYG